MVYDKSIKTDYVLIVMSAIIDGGNDPQELLARHDLNSAGGAVKSFRYHDFTAGIPNSIFSDTHCKNCKRTKQHKDRNLYHACPYPEKGDDTVEVFSYHPEHTKDRCCPEHNHHADMMHNGCFMR